MLISFFILVFENLSVNLCLYFNFFKAGLGVTKHDVSSSENSISIEASEDELSNRPHQNNGEVNLILKF